MKVWSNERGFALPTVVLASMVLMVVLSAAISITSSTSVVLREQYYGQVMKDASGAGALMAKACLQANNGTVTWSNASPLRPNTNCNGGAACTGSANCYVQSDSRLQSTFSVGVATLNAGNTIYDITVNSSVSLLRTSTQTAFKTYSENLRTTVSLAATPAMSGGAGWANAGHIGVFVSATGQLYGYGDNSAYQINDTATPATMSTPSRMSLPAGVLSVKKAVTSGQGASYLCIIGSDNQAYCRGKPGGTELSPFSGNTWNRVSGWPVNYSVFDMSMNGYGDDSACFIVGVTVGMADVYCIGNPRWGMLGTGYTCANWGGAGSCAYYYANGAQKFQLPAGVYAAKVNVMNDQTCVVTTTQDLYCSGLDNGGQVTGTTLTYVATPIKFNIPSGRKVKDVLIGGYHSTYGSYIVHVLATDGTVWSAGHYSIGDTGAGIISGTTGTTQTPVLFGDPSSGWGYGTGDIIKMTTQNKCVNDYFLATANGSPIVIHDCSTSISRTDAAMTWVYNQDPTSPGYHQIENIYTGKCLNIANSSFVSTTYLQLWDCNGSNAQKFSFQSNGLITVDASPGLCIDVPNGDTTNGRQLWIYTCSTAVSSDLFSAGGNINGWRGIIAGNNFFCGLRDDVWSGMWCAGKNNYGQLANIGALLGGGSHGVACTDYSSPINMNANAVVDWTKLTSEWQYQYDSLVFIATDGNVYGGGRNVYGKLGNGSSGDSANDYRSCSTTKFSLPAGVTAVGLSTRDEFSTYVLGSDGNLYASGRNDNGQLGIGNTNNPVYTPVKVVLPIDSQAVF